MAHWLSVSALISCGNVENIQLGRESPAFGPFGSARAHDELGSCQNPTLTEDLLEIYLTADRENGLGGNDTWFAKRSSPDDSFEPPQLVPVVNSASEESSPAIALDGLTLWFGSNRAGGAGGMDIWVSTRRDRNSDWTTPEVVTALNTSGYEIPRPLGNHGLQMPLSFHDANDNYQLMLASRSSVTASWQSPEPIAELADQDLLMVDGFLTDDGTMLLFNAEQAGNAHSEMKRTWRLSRDDGFAPPVSVGFDLNATTLNRDPWLSPDGSHFFFSSDRGGGLHVYEANVDRDQ